MSDQELEFEPYSRLIVEWIAWVEPSPTLLSKYSVMGANRTASREIVLG